MGVFEQLPTDEDRAAALTLARYLVETEGNRFYHQDVTSVCNHIAGNDQLMVEAHKFQKKFAETLLHNPDKLARALEEKAKQAIGDPVREMMDRFMDTKSRLAFMDKVEQLIKQREKQKQH